MTTWSNSKWENIFLVYILFFGNLNQVEHIDGKRFQPVPNDLL